MKFFKKIKNRWSKYLQKLAKANEKQCHGLELNYHNLNKL